MDKNYKENKKQSMSLPGSNVSRLLKLISLHQPDLLNNVAEYINTEENISIPTGHHGGKHVYSLTEDLLKNLSVQEIEKIITPNWFMSEYGTLQYEEFFDKVLSLGRYSLVEKTLPLAFDVLKNQNKESESGEDFGVNKYYEGDLISFLSRFLEKANNINEASSHRYIHFTQPVETRETQKKDLIDMWAFIDKFLKKEMKPLNKRFKSMWTERLEKISLDAQLIHALYYSDLALFKSLEVIHTPEKIKEVLTASTEEETSSYDKKIQPINALTDLYSDNASFVYHLEQDMKLFDYLNENKYLSSKVATSFPLDIQKFFYKRLQAWQKKEIEFEWAPAYIAECKTQFLTIKNKIPNFLEKYAKSNPYYFDINNTSRGITSDSSVFIVDSILNPNSWAYLPLMFSLTPKIHVKLIGSDTKNIISLNEQEFKICALLCSKLVSDYKKQNNLEDAMYIDRHANQKSTFEHIMPEEISKAQKNKTRYIKKIDVSQANMENIKKVAAQVLQYQFSSYPKDQLEIGIEALHLSLVIDKKSPADNESAMSIAQKHKI